MATEAGKGEHHVYPIVTNTKPDAPKLTPGLHYLGIDAVAWYINKQSSWFTDRMASGTLQISLANGAEQYQAALGTFELNAGARTAPVFERPVLPDRNLIGGPITLNASLTAIKKDTVIAGLLKSAANASLGIVAGMVQTASATGPAKLLSAAGEELIGGVKKVLSDTGAKREPLFDFTGLEITVQPSTVVGDEIYLLLHRGASLDEAKLTIKKVGQLMLPYQEGTLLDDGAWLMLRLRRTDEYTGARDWYAAARSLRGKIESLVADVGSDVISKDEALKQLKPSAAGTTTLFDEFARIRAIIRNDGVLSERQASAFVADLNTQIVAARKSISTTDPAAFTQIVTNVRTSVASGQRPTGAAGTAFVKEIVSFTGSRPSRKTQLPDTEKIISSIRFMPKTLKELNNVNRTTGGKLTRGIGVPRGLTIKGSRGRGGGMGGTV